MFVAAILARKGTDVITAAPSDTVAVLVSVLTRHRVGSILIVGPRREVLGIVSERDIVHALDREGDGALALTAASIMTTDVANATPHTSVETAMAMMTEGRFRHLPVIDAGELVGLVSIGDIVAAHARDQADEVDNLRAYVAGNA